MAKWGEGDPRWIVEERADATNVNNWHWTEKNATGWSKDKIKSLLEGFKLDDDKYHCEITEVKKLEGEASANNRKAKLIFFYEWVIEAEWKGRIEGDKSSYKGKIEIPNLSEEHDKEDIDVTVTVMSGDEDAYKLKEFLRKKGTPLIQDVLGKYATDLKEEFSQGMILPSKNVESNKKTAEPKENKAKAEINQVVKSNIKNGERSVRCKTLSMKEEFKCRASELYQVLTEITMVRAFTRSSVEIEAKKGGKFTLFDGNISGEFTNLDLNQQIVMRWRFKTWAAGHYSTVTLELNEKEDCTIINLTQTGIPDNDFDRTQEGWKRYYWQAIKETFGFGSQLY